MKIVRASKCSWRPLRKRVLNCGYIRICWLASPPRFHPEKLPPILRRISGCALVPALADQKQYQLWYIKGSQPDPSVAFDGSQNTKPVLVPAPDPTKGYDTIAITVEPHGGSLAPTTKPIFAGNLPKS